MRSWGAGLVLLTFGCGGVSHRDRDGLLDHSDASGGAGESNAGTSGSVGASAAGKGGAGQGAAYVDISDTTTVRLTYGADASSGSSDGTCQIRAIGRSSCGFVHLSFSACSEPNGGGVCLDTASAEPHYTDSSGTRWTMLSLTGKSAQPNGEAADGLVDLDLTLALGSESTYHELPVHAHVCASISATQIPCK